MASSFNKEDLVYKVVGRNWGPVVDILSKYPESQKVKIPQSDDTALHAAIVSCSLDSLVERMVWVTGRNALAIDNEPGDTPLHVAADLGRASVCCCIAKRDSNLIGLRNKNGETPLFVAVAGGKMDAFLCLLREINQTEEARQYVYYRRNNGDTIRHSAISEQRFGISNHKLRRLSHYVKYLKYRRRTFPTQEVLAAADRPSCFQFSYIVDRLVGYWEILLKEPEILPWENHQDDEEAANIHGNEEATNIHGNEEAANILVVDYWQNHDLDEEAANVEIVCQENHQQDEGAANEQEHEDSMGTEVAIFLGFYVVAMLRMILSCLMCPIHLISKLILDLLEWVELVVARAGYVNYARLRNIKEGCGWSVEVMQQLIRCTSKYAYEQRGMCPHELPLIDEYQYLVDISPIATKMVETPLLIAAKHGVVEMVGRILSVYPDAIFHEKKNIVMLAVEHRKRRLYQFLVHYRRVMDTLYGQVDNDGNSVLHIAAKLEGGERPWPVPGAALQMHMELKWYKFVKKLMPPHFFVGKNRDGKTPKEIFRDTHRDLIEQGRNWLISNSESCSVVAALIATVAFANSATFPGSVKQDSGIPTLENEPVFIISAVTSLIALCFSMISVVMFLGILTSSFQVRDFFKDLPFKLLVGMISLLLSTLSMSVSFFAGHHFVLKPKLKQAALPIYTLMCFPFLVFIIAKFPLDGRIVYATLHKIPRQSRK